MVRAVQGSVRVAGGLESVGGVPVSFANFIFMLLPTEPIGSIPRPVALIEAATASDGRGAIVDALVRDAVQDTIARFEATGSPVVTDGEQGKYHNFWTYPVHRMPNSDRDGFKIPFTAGHERRMPRLTRGPFRYVGGADRQLALALRFATRPVKQAVISPSALSLMYPADPIPDYSREQFLEDLLQEHVNEVKECITLGAYKVQIDFTEGRLALKLDPSGALLHSFIDLNNLALSRLTPAQRRLVGIHTCPGSDRDSTHSADVDYEELLPSLFELKAGSFYVALAGESDRARVLRIIRDNLKPGQIVFVGVVAPIDPRVETPEEICERVMEAASWIPPAQLGTTDDCGFAPFCDDMTTSRDTAFAKIRARILGTAMASRILGERA